MHYQVGDPIDDVVTRLLHLKTVEKANYTHATGNRPGIINAIRAGKRRPILNGSMGIGRPSSAKTALVAIRDIR